MKKEISSFISVIVFGFILGTVGGILIGQKIEKEKINNLYQERQEFFQAGDVKLILFLDGIESDYEKEVLEIVKNFTKEVGRSLSKAKIYHSFDPLKELNQKIFSKEKKQTSDLSVLRPSDKN